MDQVKQTAVMKGEEREQTDDEHKSDAPGSEDYSIGVVLAFITSDEEYTDERPAATRSGQAVWNWLFILWSEDLF